MRVVQVEALAVVADGGGQSQESQGTEEVIGVGLRSLEGMVVALLFNDKVQAKGLVAERNPLLKSPTS